MKAYNASKAVLRRKFIAIGVYIRKRERHKGNELSTHLKKPEKQQKNSAKIKKKYTKQRSKEQYLKSMKQRVISLQK